VKSAHGGAAPGYGGDLAPTARIEGGPQGSGAARPWRSVSGRLRRLLAPARRVVLVAGIGAVFGAAAIFFIYQMVFLYFVLTPEGAETPGAAASLASGAYPHIVFAIGVLAGGTAAGYVGSAKPRIFGLLCGITAAGAHQGIVWVGFPPVLRSELLAFGLIGVAFGVAGGALGGWFAERSATGNRRLFKALQGMSRAERPDDVAAAVAAAFAGTKPAGIGLWARNAGASEAEGTWQADGRGGFSAARLLKAAAGGATSRRVDARGGPLLPAGLSAKGLAIRTTALATPAAEEWISQGVGSVFVAPMLSSGGENHGTIVVAFAGSGTAGRLRAAPLARRRLLSVCAPALTALENIRLAREKEEGERLAGAMRERDLWAREIHDSIIQCLTGGVIKQLENAEVAHEQGSPEGAEKHRKKADVAAKLAVSEARRLIAGMRSEALRGDPLPQILTATARRVLEDSGIGLRCETVGHLRPLPGGTGDALVRVTQGALENVRKHSGASRATVRLLYLPDRVVLEVADDGKGLGGPREASGGFAGRDGGFGLRSMRGRVEDLGGCLSLGPSEDGGTLVVAEVAAGRGSSWVGNDGARRT
jgi:signal transduction histidine kinase